MVSFRSRTPGRCIETYSRKMEPRKIPFSCPPNDVCAARLLFSFVVDAEARVCFAFPPWLRTRMSTRVPPKTPIQANAVFTKRLCEQHSCIGATRLQYLHWCCTECQICDGLVCALWLWCGSCASWTCGSWIPNCHTCICTRSHVSSRLRSRPRSLAGD